MTVRDKYHDSSECHAFFCNDPKFFVFVKSDTDMRHSRLSNVLFFLQRVLAEAQAVIDKHGPDEGEEQTAAAREAAAPTAATEVEAVHETVADEPTEVAPSGYNSDSSEEGEEGSGETASEDMKGGAKVAEESRPEVAPTAEAGEESDSGSSSSSSSSDSSSDSDGGSVEKRAVVKASPPAGKKLRKKARSALTGDSKAEAKARTAMVAYERALQVAELLS